MLRRGEAAKDFWALRDVTFRIVHGESLAVIGPNGAGKSTLLQVLAGIILPVGGLGRRPRPGRRPAHPRRRLRPRADRRDNILLAGAFLGIDPKEMARPLTAIIEYADIGEFIDAPIKTYSSGMRARLGFAIATSVDPDILLLDEVLATGDATFRANRRSACLELVKAAKAIVLVTPRHGLGHRVLQPGDPAREGPRDHRGRPGRGRPGPRGAVRAGEGRS
jgi:lipopolysaccharide transport system ATP-binding protein